MTASDERLLAELLSEIEGMKLHTSRLGRALKKPLLLLLLVSRIENNRVEENRFTYDEIEKPLERLIREHGGRPTRSGARPEQPFSHLRSSPFWRLHTQKRYRSGTTVLISDLRDPKSYGAFEPNVFRLLRNSPEARARVVDLLLDSWSPTLHDDLRESLGLDRLGIGHRRQRDEQFTIDVLENYRYSCAFCGFHGLLNGRATGIDAAHVQWHSQRGPDNVANGIALCKLHHWAFDKGILGLDDSERISVADVFITQRDGGLPLESLNHRELAVRPRNKFIGSRFLDWHRKNVFLGDVTSA